MKVYGLIGKSLSHSFSKQYFENKFAQENILESSYSLFELSDIKELEQVLNNNALIGLNVTIPYKEMVIEYLDEFDDIAKEVGSVNTIKIIKDKTIGYNTDVYGFEESLKPLLASHHNKALVFGTGGAAKAVAYVLSRLNIDYQFVSTKKDSRYLKYEEITPEVLSQYFLLINTTPLGMYPNVNAAALSNFDGISAKHLVYDLIYNPIETMFLKESKAKGAIIKNGLEMLELQAEKSWEIWNELR